MNIRQLITNTLFVLSIFTYYLLWSGHCYNHFTTSYSLKPYNNLMWKIYDHHTIHGVLELRILKRFATSPGNCILSELSTMTCPSWVTLHGVAHSFIELDKAVIHEIILQARTLQWIFPSPTERSLSLLQGMFATQESNTGLLHCRQIPYQLSHKRSPRILERVA